MKNIKHLSQNFKKFAIGAGGALVAGIVSITSVAAHAPMITVDPIPALSYATFPQTYVVTGTVSLDGADDKVSSVKDLTLSVNDIVQGVVLNSPFSGNTSNTTTFQLPWTITAPGSFTVKVSARHGNDYGMDEETVLVEMPVTIMQCDAAPAVAAHYLQMLGVKSGSKTYKNVISLVAQHMTQGAVFDGVQACDTEAYASAVKAFVAANMMVAK